MWLHPDCLSSTFIVNYLLLITGAPYASREQKDLPPGSVGSQSHVYLQGAALCCPVTLPLAYLVMHASISSLTLIWAVLISPTLGSLLSLELVSMHFYIAIIAVYNKKIGISKGVWRHYILPWRILRIPTSEDRVEWTNGQQRSMRVALRKHTYQFMSFLAHLTAWFSL